MSCILLLATFQSIFNPACNPLQQTTRNVINAKISGTVLNNKLDHYFWNSIGEFNNCLHRWERRSWECWQRHDMTRDNSTFRECSPTHFELVVLLSDCFMWMQSLGRSTKCFVLKWETSVGFPPATFFADVLFFAYFKSLIKISKGFKKQNCRNCFRKTGWNKSFPSY